MKHYETPELTVLAEYAIACTVLQTSGEADGGDTNVKFDDNVWGRK